jgi:membrane protein
MLLIREPGLALHRTWQLVFNGTKVLFGSHGTQFAASMAYYAIFSVFPLAIVAAAAAGYLLGDSNARADAVEYLFRELPLSEDEGRLDVERAIDGITENAGTIGLIGLVGLLITASALISAARNAVNAIYDSPVTRGAIRGKAVDVALVLAIGTLFSISFAITLLGSLDITFGGWIGDVVDFVTTTLGQLIPPTLTVVTFTVLLRVLPTEHPPWRDIWPGVLLASIAYELLKQGFSFYLDNFADYGAVYGPLGAVVAFLFFVFLASLTFLVGASIAALWPLVRDGEFDPDPDAPEGPPLSRQIRDALGSLFTRNEDDEPHPRRRLRGWASRDRDEESDPRG